ncbi:small heat shock protein [Pisolithus thermaeus]|nr:small heat shock protein [Pisolithus croceorrhizus]KAI6158559.1 small heat shock protein [Pisolithus thermaeus]
MSSIMRFHYDPFAEFDRFFDDAFATRFMPPLLPTEGGSEKAILRPRMNLREDNEANTVTVTFELPGLKSEDVSIEIHQNRLTISGEFKEMETREETTYVVRERRQGKFRRTLQLPTGVKHEDVKAEMENGVLTIKFPKLTEEQQQTHRVTIS